MNYRLLETMQVPWENSLPVCPVLMPLIQAVFDNRVEVHVSMFWPAITICYVKTFTCPDYLDFFNDACPKNT